MTKYNFEYADISLMYRILFTSYAIFITLTLFLFYESFNTAAFISFLFFIIGPFIIVWMYRKKIKVNGTAYINENSLEFNLKNFNDTIQFTDIKSYMVQIYNGVFLRLRLNNGKKIKINANDYFCNPEQFDIFCDDLEQVFVKFKITREKSFFEKKGTYYFLVIMTVGILVLTAYAIVTGKKINFGKILISASAISTLWLNYYITKLRNDKRANSDKL